MFTCTPYDHLTNVREPRTCKRYTYSNIYFKISGVLKEVIDYDFIFFTLVSVQCCFLIINNICTLSHGQLWDSLITVWFILYPPTGKNLNLLKQY